MKGFIERESMHLPHEPIKTKAIDAEWRAGLEASAWWASGNNISSFERYLDANRSASGASRDVGKLRKQWEDYNTLHAILLRIGGEETCFAYFEEDMAAILSRGRFWNGKSKMMRGHPSQCHANVCNLYEQNKDGHRVYICTGYALSDDGMWRQHSWLLQEYDTNTQHRQRIIETTEKRVAYFGFIMTADEAEEFCDNNY